MATVQRRRTLRRRGARLRSSARNSRRTVSKSPPKQVSNTEVKQYKTCNALLSNGSGRRCTRPAGWATDHAGYGKCRKHGGNSRNLRISAAKEEIREQMPVFGIPIDTDPMEGLLRCVSISAGWVQWTMGQVHAIRQNEWLIKRKSVKRRPQSYGKEGESSVSNVKEITVDNSPVLNAAISEHKDAVDRFGRFCKMAADAGVAQAQVDLAQSYGTIIASAFAVLLEGLQLTTRQRQEAPALVERALLQLEMRTGAAL